MIDFGLSGRTALVTGAGRGIGRTCAIALADAGAKVTVLSRTAAEVEELAELIRDGGGSSVAAVCDVTDRVQVAEFFEQHGPFDVLVNNAGSNRPQPFLEVTTEALDQLLRLNVTALFDVSQAAARRMVERGEGGSIVNISSQLGHVGYPGRSVYAMTKHAVEGLTKTMALELAPHGIRVNTVAPTFIETPLTAPYLADPDFREGVLGRIPLGRLGTLEEVAAAVVFLASPAASLVTGTSLRTDGGWTAQ